MKSKITMQVNNKDFQIEAEEGRSLLDLAIMAQINPPYSCLEGVCSSCEATVLEGEARTLPGFETDQHPKVVKTCQSFPKTFPLKICFNK